MQIKIMAIESFSWVDETAGLRKSELVDMLRVQAKVSVVDPKSMPAFNFEEYGHKDDLTVNKDPAKVEDASTIATKDQAGTSLAEHTKYIMGLGDQPTRGGLDPGEEADGTETGARKAGESWEFDWMIDSEGARSWPPVTRNEQAYGTKRMGDNEKDDINDEMEQAAVVLEEQHRQASRNLKMNQSDEKEVYANQTKIGGNSFNEARSPTNQPSVQALMEQVIIF